MKKTLHVKPAAGLKIRLPDRPDKVLPKKGAHVAATAFWLRRLKDGSVLIVERSAKKGGK